MDFYKQAEEILTTYITEKKLRKTPERFHLLKAVYEYDGHFTADELHEYMQGIFRVSRATVYSNLDLFALAGLVVRNLVGNSIQYEKCLGMKTHYHMICSVCGTVREFSDASIAKAVDSARYQKFVRQNYSLNVYGVCYKCQAKINRAKRAQKAKLSRAQSSE